MKALRYLLIICTLTMAAVAFGQAQFKTSENKTAFEHQFSKTHYEFYSTSTLMGSGSSLPISARNGLKIGANTPGDNTPAGSSGRPGSPRRATMEDDPFGGETIDDTGDPLEPGTPIGDGMWALLLMAAGYLIYRVRTRRREVMA